MCRTLWVLNLCLITVTNSYCLNPVMHSRTTTYRVYSRKQTHLSPWWSSFTVYNNTSWRQNVADIFDILYKYWIFFFFFSYHWTCIYTVVYVSYVFFGSRLVEILTEMGAHVLYCHLLALVFRTGVVIVSSWRSLCDLSADPNSCLLIPPATLSPSPLSLSLSHCMVSTWPSECLQLTS